MTNKTEYQTRYYKKQQQQIKVTPTPTLVARWAFRKMKQRVNGCVHYKTQGIKVDLTQQELAKFYLKNWNLYMLLHKQWVSAKFAFGDIPTVERLNPSGNYDIKNLTLLSLRENSKKSVKYRIMGVPKQFACGHDKKSLHAKKDSRGYMICRTCSNKRSLAIYHSKKK